MAHRHELFEDGIPRDLSNTARAVWAKSNMQDPTDRHYLRLWQHLEDTASTASLIWGDFVTSDVKRLLADDLGGEDLARWIYLFLASIHDVGKASPAFQVQCSWQADRVRETGMHIDPVLAANERRHLYRHELVGYQTILEWMRTKGFSTGTHSLAYGLASIVAGHHGSAIDLNKVKFLDQWDASIFIGGTEWSSIRNELMDWTARATGFLDVAHEREGRPIPPRSQILLTALVIMADWMASNSYLFPLNEPLEDNAGGNDSWNETHFNSTSRAESAWRKINLPGPWRPALETSDPDRLFTSRFAIPNAKLRPMQRDVVDLAMTMPEPGLIIVEGNMGDGKTEAALLAAEVLAQRFGCGGVEYALPGQATANAMFGRVLSWIAHLPTGSQEKFTSLFLAHGKRELNPDFERLRQRWFNDDDPSALDAGITTVFDGDEKSRGRGSSTLVLNPAVNSWLSGRKRGNLSDFVVGTIDQVLMGALRSRHVVLRHLSFAGKVVILDEIHSNTAYMNVYMETMLSWLGAYHAPVIMLSATLPQSRREAFLKAYRQGALAENAIADSGGVDDYAYSNDSHDLDDLEDPEEADEAVTPAGDMNARGEISQSANSMVGETNGEISDESKLDYRYPLISTSSALVEPSSKTSAVSGRTTAIATGVIDDDDETLIALLTDKLRDGGCAVVIRNTVSRAQHAFDVLSEAFDIDVILDHSRFIACDRASIDRDLISRFGKDGSAEDRNAIVVATQVVEQSLDVDFDVMVSDIAPIDLILQRAGRLHRHRRGDNEMERPNPVRQAQLYIAGIQEWRDGGAPVFDRGCENIYTRFQLLRSLAVLDLCNRGSHTVVTVPDDIPRLVQPAYAHIPLGPDSWQDDLTKAEQQFDQKRQESEDKARHYRIPWPDDQREGGIKECDLSGWLTNALRDPESAKSGSKNGFVSTGVREGDDSFEVIVLERDSDGQIRLPQWSGFSSEPLPIGVGLLSAEQIHDILTCTISLGRSALKYVDMDAAIAAIENSAPDVWFDYQQQSSLLRGQLMLLLDSQGKTSLTIDDPSWKGHATVMTIHYSTTKGWEVSQ
ncbi:CRISPR-associated helicase/endonuclease Cas3 [Bifidobacterium minimum]|nr:CRISPR-associated helicase/endonuclease Cas3 [Bifidobacterium minimum]